MKKIPYARKKRQLRNLAKRLNLLESSGRENMEREILILKTKIKYLLNDLLSVFSKRELKRVIGGVAMTLGIFVSSTVTAQTFGPPVENPFGLTSTVDMAFPTFADLDNDGDQDLLVGEYYGALQYYENTGSSTDPQYAAPVLNPFGILPNLGFSFPTFADLDDDGDMDLLIGEYYGNFGYYENTGSASSPQFAAPATNPFGLTNAQGFAIPAFVDMDGDGDMDIIVGEYYGDMGYYENTGTATNPAFATPVKNPFGLTPGYYIACPSVADLDNDGDMDLMVGEYYGALQYFENTGSVTNPQFASAVENPFGLVAVQEISTPAMTDLDGDGDIDLLVGEYYGDMQYFRNDLINSVENLSEVDLDVYPNPVSNILNIDTNNEIDNIQVFNLLGQKVFSSENVTPQLNLSSLNKGMYSIRIELESGEIAINKFQKL